MQIKTVRIAAAVTTAAWLVVKFGMPEEIWARLIVTGLWVIAMGTWAVAEWLPRARKHA